MKKITFKIATLAAVILLTASCSTESELVETALATNKALIFTTSNTSGNSEIISSSNGQLTAERSLSGTSQDNAGVFYDPIEDCLIQASRTAKEVQLYDNVKFASDGDVIRPASVSADGFLNARDIAYNNADQIIVSSDATQAGDANMFFIYDVSNAGLLFKKQFVTANQNWGIDLNGNDMYAVNNNSNRVAIFNDVFTQTGQELPVDNLITIDGATNLKGLTYDRTSDILILTDVRNQFSDTDGAIFIIENFTTKLNAVGPYGVITNDMYRKIEGSNTTLGTPLDVQYNAEDGMIYVADRSTASGSVMTFDIRNSQTNVAPVSSHKVRGVSSIYLKK